MARTGSCSTPPPPPSHEHATPYQTLILENRAAAHRVGRSLMRRLGVTVSSDERDASIDLALCEAAATFDPERGTSLITWFFYALRSEISHLLEDQHDRGSSFHPLAVCLDSDDTHDGDYAPFQIAAADPSPEQQSFLEDLRSVCLAALQELPDLERTVVLETFLAEEKVAKLARRLGYSRGHLSLVKSSGARRLRELIRRSHRDCDWDWDNSPKRAA